MRKSFAGEWIDKLHASFPEIRVVARGDGQIVNESCRCDQAVLDRHRPARRSKRRKQFCPSQAGLCFPSQAVKALNTCLEPSFQPGSALSFRQQQNAESNLAENDRVDDDIALVTPEPPDNGLVGRRPGWLAQDVGVDEERHRVSVDSDSMETKKSFSGHARSQSTTPSLVGAVRRRR